MPGTAAAPMAEDTLSVDVATVVDEDEAGQDLEA